MNIILVILCAATTACCIISNIYVTKKMSAKEMYSEFIDGQCFVGRVFANIFYAPAWFLKGFRFVVVALIK